MRQGESRRVRGLGRVKRTGYGKENRERQG